MPIEKVLVVDDDLRIRTFLTMALEKEGLEVISAEHGAQALSHFQNTPTDVVITDMKMPGMSGLELLKEIKILNPQTLTIVITAFGSIENAVEAMRLGAFNYLIKPFSFDTLEAILEKAKEHLQLLEENAYLRAEATAHSCPLTGIVGESEAMKRVRAEVAKIAQSQASVLISGESGTGKEVVAHAIHHQSPRAQKPYIKVNCAAIPETLVESEFFGHEKGAFTGANAKKLGRFELAHQGTLLLDEVTEIPILLQSKLLRAIQEHEFERVGGTKPIQVDVRLISTSNRNLKEAIEQRIFREDLYYRLNVIPIHLPPLRERPEDILPLARHFLERLCRENHTTLKEVTKEAEKKLLSYPWPGNARELANILERAVVMHREGEIAASHLYLGEERSGKSSGVSTSLDFSQANLNKSEGEYSTMSLKEVERKLILQRLKECHQDNLKAAESLGISLKQLKQKLSTTLPVSSESAPA